jgi:hypothetical protein
LSREFVPSPKGGPPLSILPETGPAPRG